MYVIDNKANKGIDSRLYIIMITLWCVRFTATDAPKRLWEPLTWAWQASP